MNVIQDIVNGLYSGTLFYDLWATFSIFIGLGVFVLLAFARLAQGVYIFIEEDEAEEFLSGYQWSFSFGMDIFFVIILSPLLSLIISMIVHHPLFFSTIGTLLLIMLISRSIRRLCKGLKKHLSDDKVHVKN